ncbi:hypothetical protein [Halorussus halobius]|uniref:hypothetical protein n=1 Tax=Halorussus halobius TaxID=1710537 RepID=UPI0010921BE1|nr:hypothetical protein [Halorussus halobius]
MSRLWNELSRRELAVAALISLILLGLLARNLVDATTREESVRAVAVVVVLALVFGYRIVSRHLDARPDGALLLVVGGVGVAVLLAAAPSAFDAELVAAFGALALLGGALVVAPSVDLSTRAFGGVLVLAGVGIVGAEVVVFREGRGVVLGGLVALVGALTVLRPAEFERLEREAEQ